MKPKLRIATAESVAVSAYHALLEKGYGVRREKLALGDLWVAESEQVELIADDPTSLLGLVALLESRGADWMSSDSQIQEFIRQFGKPAGR